MFQNKSEHHGVKDTPTYTQHLTLSNSQEKCYARFTIKNHD